jgi:hypothetical protein
MDSPHAPFQVPIEAALRAVAERQRRELGAHLEIDELVAYHQGTLPEESAERARDHLSLCPECAGRLLDLDSFYDTSPAGVPDAAAEAAWRELAPRLGKAEQKAPVVPLPRRTGSPILPWAVAAALLLAVLGAGARMANLQREMGEYKKPHTDAVVARILPVDDPTRGTEKPLPSYASSRFITALLVPPPEGWHSAAFDLEIRDAAADGPPLWRSRAEPDDQRDLVVALPSGSLRPGTYRLLAYGLAAGKRLSPVEYELVLGR